MQDTTCKLCGQKIVWAHGSSGLYCLDAVPAPEGELMLVNGKVYGIVWSPFASAMYSGPRYTNHTGTCKVWMEKHKRLA